MRHALILALLVAGCGGRPVTPDLEPTELELLCESWCSAQLACGFSSGYSPEGECTPNCTASRGWDIAWEGGCQEEARAVLSCLSDSTCEDLAPMFDPVTEALSPCADERSAILACSI